MTAHALTAQLRDMRTVAGLSLHQVEKSTAGRWKAVVIGSYERGDRTAGLVKTDEYVRQVLGQRVAFIPADVSDAGLAKALQLVDGVDLAEVEAGLAIARMLAGRAHEVAELLREAL